ncbi:hypothetical protein [Cytobacillus praedii]|uniref:Uncharacterized protein n=1 Tax=Cytobacillus praedii TaxID=1742358 RepID=A0A4R1AT24_9BACI|nr:hypothetical protein [Cytobacillus praedii]TCJ00426.1 hypothetical protein E0Y62_26900 [Cytobacillus praedii]
MYKHINEAIDKIIEFHKTLDPKKHNMTKEEAHYYIQGLEVAKQLVEQTQEIDTGELAFETFENVVRNLSAELDQYDMEEIIGDVFMEKEKETI